MLTCDELCISHNMRVTLVLILFFLFATSKSLAIVDMQLKVQSPFFPGKFLTPTIEGINDSGNFLVVSLSNDAGSRQYRLVAVINDQFVEQGSWLDFPKISGLTPVAEQINFRQTSLCATSTTGYSLFSVQDSSRKGLYPSQLVVVDFEGKVHSVFTSGIIYPGNVERACPNARLSNDGRVALIDFQIPDRGFDCGSKDSCELTINRRAVLVDQSGSRTVVQNFPSIGVTLNIQSNKPDVLGSRPSGYPSKPFSFYYTNINYSLKEAKTLLFDSSNNLHLVSVEGAVYRDGNNPPAQILKKSYVVYKANGEVSSRLFSDDAALRFLRLGSFLDDYMDLYSQLERLEKLSLSSINGEPIFGSHTDAFTISFSTGDAEPIPDFERQFQSRLRLWQGASKENRYFHCRVPSSVTWLKNNFSLSWVNSDGTRALLGVASYDHPERDIFGLIDLESSRSAAENFCLRAQLSLGGACRTAYYARGVLNPNGQTSYRDISYVRLERGPGLSGLIEKTTNVKTIECAFELKVFDAYLKPISGLRVLTSRRSGFVFGAGKGMRLTNISSKAHRIYKTDSDGKVKGILNLKPIIPLDQGNQVIMEIGWRSKKYQPFLIIDPTDSSI